MYTICVMIQMMTVICYLKVARMLVFLITRDHHNCCKRQRSSKALTLKNNFSQSPATHIYFMTSWLVPKFTFYIYFLFICILKVHLLALLEKMCKKKIYSKYLSYYSAIIIQGRSLPLISLHLSSRGNPLWKNNRLHKITSIFLY